jgi:hypothetical protein
MSLPRTLSATRAAHFAAHRRMAFVTDPCVVPARTLLSQLP